MSSLPKPSAAFIGASYFALALGVVTYFIGLFNATIGLGEKGYYVILMLYGLFSVISLQKTVRDQQQGIPVTGIYYYVAWVAALSSLALMAIGLYNATFTLAEKGFYGMAYVLSLFAAITVQKNVRDTNAIKELEGPATSPRKERSWFKSDLGSSKSDANTTVKTNKKPE